MMMFKTAFLSLLSHKSKTIILMIVLAFGGFLTLTGLSFMHTFVENLRTGLTQAVSGDIVVHSSFVRGNVDIVMPFQQVPPMEDFDKAIDVLEEHEQVTTITPLIKDAAMLIDPLTDEFDAGLPIIGARIDEYMDVFSKTVVIAKMDLEGEEYDPDKTYDVIMTRDYLEELPENQDDRFISMLPDDMKQQLIDMLSEEDLETYKNLSEEDLEKNYLDLFTDKQKKEFIDGLSDDKKFEIVNNYYQENYNPTILTDSIDVDEGTLIPEGEKGILLSKKFIDRMMRRPKRVRQFADAMRVGGKIKIQSFTKRGSISIIELTVFGIIDIPGSDFAMMNNVIDLKTFQKIVGYDAESKALTVEQKIALQKNEELFEMETDDLFSDMDSLFSEEGDEEDIDKEQFEDDEVTGVGSTHYVTARLKNPSLMNKVISELNNTFKERNLNFRVSGYVEASGNLGAFISLVSILVTIIILIIQTISIIIITNSVLMGILERVNEIGTMRAIGAQRGYIFRLIFSESFLLATISAIIGIAISLLFLWIFGLIGFEPDNFITSILFGGEKLIPRTNIFYILLTIIIIIASTFIATLYPVSIATKVSPLEAMNRT